MTKDIEVVIGGVANILTEDLRRQIGVAYLNQKFYPTTKVNDFEKNVVECLNNEKRQWGIDFNGRFYFREEGSDVAN